MLVHGPWTLEIGEGVPVPELEKVRKFILSTLEMSGISLPENNQSEYKKKETEKAYKSMV